VYDAGYKEGAIGWYCNDCQDTQVDDIQLYQNKCTKLID